MTGSLLARRSTKFSMAEQGLGCSSVVDHRGPGSIPSAAHRHRGRLYYMLSTAFLTKLHCFHGIVWFCLETLSLTVSSLWFCLLVLFG